MPKHAFHTKIKIETLQKQLSCDNLWMMKFVPWREVWASVLIKYVSSKGALYLFKVRWRGDFPQEFRIVMGSTVFRPIQSPIVDPSQDLILFHADIDQ